MIEINVWYVPGGVVERKNDEEQEAVKGKRCCGAPQTPNSPFDFCRGPISTAGSPSSYSWVGMGRERDMWHRK